MKINAVEPADGNIKGALYDINKYEQQFASKTSERASTINRTLKLLNLTRGRLDSSSHKNDDSWIDADTRYKALVAHLQSLLAPNQSSPTKVAAAPAIAPQQAVPSQTSPQAMISQQRVRIKKLIRDIASGTSTLDQEGVKPFQSPQYVEKKKASLARYKASLAKYSQFPQDPDVIEAGNAVAAFENMLVFGQNHAAKEIEYLGDIQTKLGSLDVWIKRVPSAPVYPYTGKVITDWVISLATTREASVKAINTLNIFKDRAYLPDQRGTVQQGAAYDMQDLTRLESGLRRNIAQGDASLEQFKMDIDLQVGHVADTLSYFDRLNPADQNDQSNSFLGAGVFEENTQRLVKESQLVNSAVDFDKLLKRDVLAAHSQVLARVTKAETQYQTNYREARKLVRMPRAASTDSSLLKIAEDTLGNPRYEVGPIQRMVINTEKVTREKETSETEFDKADISLSGTLTLSGTETTYFYKWEEFQVATAEQVGEKYYIFYSTLKYFTSGASTTPLNKWILSGRIQGSEIPKANIDK